MTQRESGVEQAARVLPLRLRSGVMSLPEDRRSQIEELRLRVGLPMAAVLPEGERALAGPPVTQQELERQRREDVSSWPKISVCTALYNTDPKFLKEFLNSFLYQTDQNSELCLADASDSEHAYVRQIVSACKSARIQYVKLDRHAGISASVGIAIARPGDTFEELYHRSDKALYQAKAEGEAMDLSHGLPYAASMQIYAGTYDDVADCAMVILTAGANQKPGETRLDLIDKNVAILKSIIPELTKRLFQGILLVVSNPVDVLTYAAWKLSGLPAKHVIGSGTVLDTARLKYLLGQYLGVDSRNVHAAIIGEHGDSELAVWSSANISSLDLDHFCQLRGKKNYRAELDRIYHEVRDSAYEIIERKGATYYGIAMAVARIAECIVKNESAMLPISAVLEGEYGLKNLCLSIPAIVGQDGVETVLEIPLAPQEKSALLSSAQQLQEVIGHLELS